MKKYSAFIVISFSFVAGNVFAARPTFHCYSYPNAPVQSYEYSGKCGGVNSKGGELVGKNAEKSKENPDGTKDILCTYQGACRPGDNSEPPEQSATAIDAALMTGSLKPSILVCLGRGRVDVNGQVSEAICPSPSKCQRDVFYNFVSRAVSPGEPVGVVTPKASEDGRSTRDQRKSGNVN